MPSISTSRSQTVHDNEPRYHDFAVLHDYGDNLNSNTKEKTLPQRRPNIKNHQTCISSNHRRNELIPRFTLYFSFLVKCHIGLSPSPEKQIAILVVSLKSLFVKRSCKSSRSQSVDWEMKISQTFN